MSPFMALLLVISVSETELSWAEDGYEAEE